MNSIIKSLLAATAGLAMSVAPAHARIENETGDLLKLMSQNGISVTINSEACDGTVHGTYSFTGMRRTLNLCPGDEIDAIDHTTVRHEAWHVIQHCVNVARGTALNSPVQTDVNELAEVVNETVPADIVEFVKRSYPQEHWLVEFEAQAASIVLTSSDIMEVFSDVCTAK